MTRADLRGTLEHVVMLALLRLKSQAYGMTVRLEIERRTGRSISIGAVYTTLDRLESKGLVISFLGPPTAMRGGRAKRCFRVAAKAERALRESERALRPTAPGFPLRPGAPPAAARLLKWALPSGCRDAIIGDLVEEYGLRLQHQRAGAAARWLWSQIFRSLPPLLGFAALRRAWHITLGLAALHFHVVGVAGSLMGSAIHAAIFLGRRLQALVIFGSACVAVAVVTCLTAPIGQARGRPTRDASGRARVGSIGSVGQTGEDLMPGRIRTGGTEAGLAAAAPRHGRLMAAGRAGAVPALAGMLLASGAVATAGQSAESPAASAQRRAASASTIPGCDSREHAQLDFWLGEWDVHWTASDGRSGVGSNRVRREHGGCVVVERYEDATTTFSGTSISSYQRRSGQWLQAFMGTGGFAYQAAGRASADGAAMEFQLVRQSEAQPEARIRFEEVTPDSLTWRFQMKPPGGAWTDLSVSRYRRRPSVGAQR